MRFWWFVMIFDSIVPCIMLLGGRMMWKHCPEDVNGVVGYRTTRSMLNHDTWIFANQYCGKLWWRMELFLLVFTVLVHFLFLHAGKDVLNILTLVLLAIQMVVIFGSIFATEHALKKNFDENGMKK